jgi:hypothetical protein
VVALFLDGQGVHVEAQQDSRAGLLAFQKGDDARLADAGLHLQPQPGQPLGHDGRRARLLEAEFGVAVQVAPDAHHVVEEGGGLFAEVGARYSRHAQWGVLSHHQKLLYEECINSCVTGQRDMSAVPGQCKRYDSFRKARVRCQARAAAASL